MQFPDQKKAVTYVLLAVLFWSTVASAFKLALQTFNSFQLLFWTSFVSLMVLGILLLFNGEVKNLRLLKVNEIALSLTAGFLNPFLYYTLLFKAYDIAPAQEAMVLNYSWPLVLVLLSIPVLKQKINRWTIASFIICIIGICIVILNNENENNKENKLGDILALGSSLIWAAYWLINMKNKSTILLKLFLAFFSGTIFSLLSNLFFSDFIFPNISNGFLLIYIGCFEMSITFIFWLSALKYARSTASISGYIYITPFLSLFCISIVLHEKFLLNSFIGLILIISGIIINEKFQLKKQN